MSHNKDFSDNSKKTRTPSQGRQTLFRVTYRTQINLIRIADNKANMIMGINP
jgi:phage-related tail fiber protein